jgi:hypothetical protein
MSQYELTYLIMIVIAKFIVHNISSVINIHETSTAII